MEGDASKASICGAGRVTMTIRTGFTPPLVAVSVYCVVPSGPGSRVKLPSPEPSVLDRTSMLPGVITSESKGSPPTIQSKITASPTSSSTLGVAVNESIHGASGSAIESVRSSIVPWNRVTVSLTPVIRNTMSPVPSPV